MRHFTKFSIAVSLLIFFISTGIKAQSATSATLEATLSLQDVNGVKVPYQNGIPLPSFEKQRTIIDLAGTWKKQRFDASDQVTLAKRDAAAIAQIESEANGRQLASYNDSAWEDKTLPGVENQLRSWPITPVISYDYDAIYYRRTFQIDTSFSGKYVKLIFYAVNYIADVWINDHYVGYHEGGHTPFAFDISPYLTYGGSNTIAVRVHNVRWNSNKFIVPYNTPDWFNYDGIYHDVYLEISDPLNVVRTNIVPKDIDGNIDAAVIINNTKNTASNVTAKIQVYEADVNDTNIQSEFASDLAGTEVTLSGTTENEVSVQADNISVWKTSLQIPNPKIWTPKNPNLYIMKVTLTENGIVVDEYYTQFGVRTIGTKGNKFLLNNRIMFFTGTARHEEHPDYGKAVPKEIIYSDLKMVKSIYANFLRTAHYPNHLYTYLIADRIGLTIMEEIPVFWFDHPEAWQHQEQRRITYQMFREMVFKDYNRPSIILWSTSNECLDVANRAIYNQNIVNDQRENYYDGRLVSQSAAADRPGANDASQAPLDAAGWTMYFGVFHKYNNAVRKSETYAGTFDFLSKVRTEYPDKPAIDTEFGYWSGEHGTSYEDQNYIFDNTFRAFKLYAALSQSGTVNESFGGGLMAATWWCIFDWYQFKNIVDTTQLSYQTMGLYSMDRQTAKPVLTKLKIAYLPYFNQEGVLTDVEKKNGNEIPAEFSLEQNYPNPFNPGTTISYKLQASGYTTLKIYDILGREVSTLVNEFQQAGEHAVQLSTNDLQLSSGVYFYKLQVYSPGRAGDYTAVRKMILLK